MTPRPTRSSEPDTAFLEAQGCCTVEEAFELVDELEKLTPEERSQAPMWPYRLAISVIAAYRRGLEQSPFRSLYLGE